MRNEDSRTGRDTRCGDAAHWPVYVINMAENTTRMSAVSKALSRLDIPFQRFDAVNGRALSLAERARIYDPQENARKFRLPLIPGELGCYLSHIALWRKIAKSDAPGAVILEDDFAPEAHLGEVLRRLSADSGPWDMVKLYSRRPAARMIRERPLGPGLRLALPYQIPNTMLGYVIRREAAVRLLRDALPIARPIDEDHKRFWEHGLAIWLVLPPPLGLGGEALATNTIGAARKRGGRRLIRATLRRGWRNLCYRVAYLAHLHCNRLCRRENMPDRAGRP